MHHSLRGGQGLTETDLHLHDALAEVAVHYIALLLSGILCTYLSTPRRPVCAPCKTTEPPYLLRQSGVTWKSDFL